MNSCKFILSYSVLYEVLKQIESYCDTLKNKRHFNRDQIQMKGFIPFHVLFNRVLNSNKLSIPKWTERFCSRLCATFYLQFPHWIMRQTMTIKCSPGSLVMTSNIPKAGPSVLQWGTIRPQYCTGKVGPWVRNVLFRMEPIKKRPFHI